MTTPTRPTLTPARAFAASAVAGLAVLAPVAAHAGKEHVQKQITKGIDPHLLIGEAWMQNLSNGQERWDDFYTSEQSLRGPSAGWSVCNYQGGWKIQNPDGSVLDTRYTAFHAGCSYVGYYQSTATAGTYAENKRFTAMWKSDYTNGTYTNIGSMSD
jgi:hypothetical protein